ncbi:MAG: hypothetical protein EBU52_00085 [Cytophagia bacterium]|nr:hypothetical protein [Cytophagia bacterium]
MVKTLNWFEIPATDFARAKAFYAKVLDAQIHDDPNRPYAYLPADPQKGEFGGAIGFGENFVPSTTGTTVYLDGGKDLSIPLGIYRLRRKQSWLSFHEIAFEHLPYPCWCCMCRFCEYSTNKFTYPI